MNASDQTTAARRAAPPRPAIAVIVGTIAAFVSCAALGTGIIGFLSGNVPMGIAASVALIGGVGTVVNLVLALLDKRAPNLLWLRIFSGITVVGGGIALTTYLWLSTFEMLTPIALGLSIVCQLLILVASFTHYR